MKKGILGVLLLASVIAVMAQSRPGSNPGTLYPSAKPGQCYAKVLLPAEYNTVTEDVVTREASQKFEIVPAKYKWATEKVVVKDKTQKLVPVPAVWETKTEKIEIAPASRIWRTGPNSRYRYADPTIVAAASALGVPSTAKPGDCFAEYIDEAKYKTEPVKVVAQQASQTLQTIPAKYEWVTEKVLVKPASSKIVETPAVYETKTEKVLETPATTTWKAGRGPTERIDHTTGEIMCLVEVPAKYKTVTRRVLKTPATTKKVEIPAEYKTVKKQKLVSGPQEKRVAVSAVETTINKKVKVSDRKVYWRAKGSPGPGKATERQICLAEIPAKHQTVTKKILKTPPSFNKVDVPATYADMRVRKLVSPATERRVEVPATKAKLTKQIKVSDGKLEWRPVLCETNMTRDLITQIQKALKGKGFNPGPIDGLIGAQTLAAVGQFQQRNGLARGGLTMKTLESLNVKAN